LRQIQGISSVLVKITPTLFKFCVCKKSNGATVQAFFSSATAYNKMEMFSCHEAGISSAALLAPLLMPCYVIAIFQGADAVLSSVYS
jgi:hypothetical protein